MLRRCGIALLLVIQALGGSAITLAHSRDVVAAPASVESGHDARCAILHDEVRCALCHYAATRMAVQQILLAPASHVQAVHFVPTQLLIAGRSVEYATAPARGPPAHLS